MREYREESKPYVNCDLAGGQLSPVSLLIWRWRQGTQNLSWFLGAPDQGALVLIEAHVRWYVDPFTYRYPFILFFRLIDLTACLSRQIKTNILPLDR